MIDWFKTRGKTDSLFNFLQIKLESVPQKEMEQSGQNMRESPRAYLDIWSFSFSFSTAKLHDVFQPLEVDDIGKLADVNIPPVS